MRGQAVHSPRAPLPPLDPEGFLEDPAHWSPVVAERLAAEEAIELTPAHWEVLALLRRYYERFDSSPSMRPLVKFCRQELGADKGSSLYLLTLFPGSPAKVGARIAGLPRPEHCL